MQIDYGNGKTKYGPGVLITLDADELAKAVDLWLYSQDAFVSGPRTITFDGELARDGMCSVYVDPSGSVVLDGEKFSGRGPEKQV